MGNKEEETKEAQEIVDHILEIDGMDLKHASRIMSKAYWIVRKLLVKENTEEK